MHHFNAQGIILNISIYKCTGASIFNASMLNELIHQYSRLNALNASIHSAQCIVLMLKASILSCQYINVLMLNALHQCSRHQCINTQFSTYQWINASILNASILNASMHQYSMHQYINASILKLNTSTHQCINYVSASINHDK